MRIGMVAAAAAGVMVAATVVAAPAMAGADIGDTPRESGANYAVWLDANTRKAVKVCVYREAFPEMVRTAIIEVVMKRGDMGRERARRHWAEGYRPVIAQHCRGLGF